MVYHVGIAAFQVRRLQGGVAGAGAVAAGALCVHAPLAVMFAAAVVFCARR